MKRTTLLICAFLLTVLLVCLPTEIKAAEVLNNGTCGDNLTWVLTDDGTLTISGTGKMDNYSTDKPAPWSTDIRVSSVVIENGVTSIGSYAFQTCLSIEQITIPDSVTSIGSYAFQKCTGLTGLDLPSSITTIPDGMIAECTRIMNFTIPESVTSIGNEAFRECINLPEIIIPKNVTSIGNNAFSKCIGFKSVTIPDSVSTIGEYAFSGCSRLQSITIGKGVTSIGANAFRNCDTLNDVYIADVADWCGISFGFPFANPLHRAVLHVNGKVLTTLTVPDGVTSIGNYAFSDYAQLTSVTLSDSVTEIGNCAFNNCANLSNVTLSDSIVSIGEYAFRSCPVRSITFGENLTNLGFAAFQHCKALTSITIPDNVVSIGEIAFYGCDAVTDLTLGKGIAEIGPSAFEKCDALWHVLYRGTTAEWEAISIDKANKVLANTPRHDNYTGDEQIDFVNKVCAICSCTHAWDDGTVTKESTCKESGTTTYTCTLCHSAKTEEIAKLTTHTPGAPATATTDQTCTVCGEVLEKATGETEPAPTVPEVEKQPDKGLPIWMPIASILLIGAIAAGMLLSKKKD